MSAVAIGIIGVGKIAVDQHIPSIQANPDFTLLATASPKAPNIPESKHNFSDYRDVLAMAEIDAVAICTPPQVRYRIARDAIAAGKHVLIEKPPAASLSELMDLAEAADRAGVTFFTAWHSQHNKAVDLAAKELRTREVTRLKITWKEDVRHWHPGQTWIWKAGGFGVFDPGINALSIATRILPQPLFVTRADLEFPSNCDAPIAAALTFASADRPQDEDLSAVFDFRQTGLQTWDIEVGTRDGMSLVLSSGGTKLTIDGASVVDEPPAEYPSIYVRFAELIRSRTSFVDDAPFRLVADAFMLGRRTAVEPFYD
jgi:D-galactose 1-dehydrogenase